MAKVKSKKLPSHRKTGKSLGIAHVLIGVCLSNPEVTIDIYDHYPTEEAKQIVYDYCCRLIEMQELDGFIINRNKMTIKYSLKD